MLKLRHIAFAAMLLAACTRDAAAPEQERHCTQPDSGERCSQADTATKQGTTWTVTIYLTTQRTVEYRDGGYVCTRTVTSCAERTCTYVNAPSNWTAAGVIAMCRGS